MAINDFSRVRRRPGLLGWFGRYRRDPVPGAGLHPVHSPPPDASAIARLEQVAGIGRFLVAHNLAVSTFALSIAHDYLTGEDKRLVRLIDRQVRQHAPVTATWLEDIRQKPGSDDDRAAMSSLMAKLQNNLEDFDRTTTAAKSAASDYSSALEVKVDEMHRTTATNAVIADLAHLAQAMLDRTRELEKEMARSDQQTKALQRSLDQARISAEKDHLTGLPNRRAFEARLASEYAAAQASHEPLCIAFCDIDNFKAINDTHGHEAGDRILKTVAQNLARIASAKCHVARHGGEEFVVLFRGTSVHDCWELLDEARTQQAERRLVNRATDVPFGKVTFSAGLTEVFAFPDPRSALRAADQALYRAKEEGRNRIVIADHVATSALEQTQ